MWAILSDKGYPTGEEVTNEEAVVMILSGEWVKGLTCDKSECACHEKPVLFRVADNETPF